MSSGAVVLYSSADVHQTIKRIFREPHGRERRVAVVAYVGDDAEAYLPDPDRLEVVCCPAPAATSPLAIRSLLKRGASVRFADSLHMKVYWSSHRGCVITSANLSSAALGMNGLKEAGIFLPPGRVDVDRLLRYANPHKITTAEMRALFRGSVARRQTRKRKSANRRQDYLDWYNAPYRDAARWKWAWWEGYCKPCSAAKAVSHKHFGVPKPYDWINCQKAEVRAGDWLLCFQLTDAGANGFGWQHVDYVVQVQERERGVYEARSPYQAIQVHTNAHYPAPPFHITPGFRSAFNKAIAQHGVTKLKEQRWGYPPRRLLDRVARALR